MLMVLQGGPDVASLLNKLQPNAVAFQPPQGFASAFTETVTRRYKLNTAPIADLYTHRQHAHTYAHTYTETHVHTHAHTIKAVLLLFQIQCAGWELKWASRQCMPLWPLRSVNFTHEFTDVC